ncbi:MAG: hypothetical protein K9G58_01620 [Bacteroidales bacterium]|nr:hypothetical protein [Bacteroidales bacterium]MCF8388422.1 hypothetical protein [Bacteroidales bacterium]MCF8396835.1 hypothetical protein [Bacteroidales bacterium]
MRVIFTCTVFLFLFASCNNKQEQIKEEGVVIIDSIAEYEYGKFVHIMDPDGNKIELWKPVDSVFTDLYKGETTK